MVVGALVGIAEIILTTSTFRKDEAAKTDAVAKTAVRDRGSKLYSTENVRY
jgi:hypothetical protein